MVIVLLFLLLLTATVIIFINQPKFGKIPGGEMAEKISKSPHYKKGSFQNLSPTPNFSEGVTFFKALNYFLFSDRKRVKPVDTIPSIKTNLFSLDPAKNVLVWFGHSSYFLQVDGKKILVDPVLSGAASPISFTTKAFRGTDIYTTDDIPAIDYLFITHDHWDHLDYSTLQKLKPKIKKIICGLGAGEHLRRWGFDRHIILEMDWNEQAQIDDNLIVHTIPARHFSGRGFRRNKSLWLSFALRTPSSNIFIGGDSGYDTHFAEAGKILGPFDLAILENGQYDKHWKYIHMIPAEVLQAAKDLRAKKLLPVHSAKFALGLHEWDEPLKTITALHNNDDGLQLLTPMIGEEVDFMDKKLFSQWWKGVL